MLEQSVSIAIHNNKSNNNKTGISSNSNKDEIQTETTSSSIQIENSKDLDELPNEEINTKAEKPNFHQKIGNNTEIKGGEEKEPSNYLTKPTGVSNDSTSQSPSENQNYNIQLMNLFINSQQNPLFLNLFNNLKNVQNLGQLYPNTKSNDLNNNNNNNNMNEGPSKNIEVFKTKLNANNENQNDTSLSGELVSKRKKNEPIHSNNESASTAISLSSSDLAPSQITNLDSGLVGKNAYKSKIKSHRHHHHHHSHNSSDVNPSRAQQRQRDNLKKTDVENTNLAKQTLNTSISSSFTSTSSVSAVTGAYSSLSSSPSSSSPSLTSSSSITSSEPSSPSISPNLETRPNMSNLNSIKETTSTTTFTHNVNTKLKKLTKSNTLQNESDSFQESFESTNNELQTLMRFNNNKIQFSQSMSVPKLTMPYALLGTSSPSSSNTAPTTPTLLNLNKKKTPNTSMTLSHNEYFNFGSNPSILPSHSTIPHNSHSLSVSNIVSGPLDSKNGGSSIATPSTSASTVLSTVPPSNNNGVSSEVKQILKNHLLRRLDKQNNNPLGPGGGGGATSHPLNHSLSQLPDITNQKSLSNNFMSEISIGASKRNPTNSQQQIQSKASHHHNQQQNMLHNQPFQQNHNQQQQLHPYLLNLFNTQHQLSSSKPAESSPSISSSKKTNQQINYSKIAIDELIDENNLRRTTSEPNLKVKSALKDRLLEKRNLLNPFTQNKRENRQQQYSNAEHEHQHHHSKQSSSTSNSNRKYLDLNAKSSSLIQQSSQGTSQSASMINHPLSGSLSKLYENNTSLNSGSNNASHYNHFNYLQQQKFQQDASMIAAAVANAVANSNNSMEIAAALKVALQEQFSRVAAINTSHSFLDSTNPALNHYHYNQYVANNSEKMHSSISYPTLPSSIYNNSPNLNHSFDSQHNQNHPAHHHLSGKTKKDEEYAATIKKMPKFGHAAHVEEDSELLLENELKNAAQQNEAKTSLIYDNQRNVTEINMDEEDEERPSGEIREGSEAGVEEELDPVNNIISPNRQIKRLERANSHYTYKQFASNFNRHSQQLYQHLPPSYNSFMNSSGFNASSSLSSASYDRFVQFQQQQKQRLGNHTQSHGTDGSHHHQFDKDPHNPLVQMHQQELEELKLKQLQFHNASKSSFFSDPHLLKSLRIANSNSNTNLDMASKIFSTNFAAVNDKNKIIFNKNNQADVSKISILPTKSMQDAELSAKKSHLACNESSKMDMDTDYSSENKVYRYTTGIVYDKIMLKHECTCGNQSNHLETPNRIKSIWNRFKANNIHDECELVRSKLATISDLLTCHNEQYSLIFGSDLESRPRLPPEYLQNYMMNVTLASCQGFALTYDQDNSWNEEFTPIACRVAVGSTYELASLVSAGKLKNGFALVRPPGSHAEYNKPLGFCYFNTVAIVAKMLKRNLSLDRILIVDWDVHHGNGTQQMTYTDSNIMYISLHRHDNATFFPGTGSIYECGQDNGLGKNVNIAWNGKLNPPMSDAEYLAAFRCVVMPIAQAFKPQIVLVSCGFDGTENHPKELGGYKLSPMCFAYMTKKLMSLAEGKLVLALEGGYDINSLCDCSELCINALLDKQIPSFPNETLDALPNNSAILDLENVIEVQRKFWPNLRNYRQYIRMSQNQFIGMIND